MLALAEAIIRIRFKIDGALRLRCKVAIFQLPSLSGEPVLGQSGGL